MTLAKSRIVLQGETSYAHEREAIDFAIELLPNQDPYYLWALLELLDPSSGRLYELDMLVLGYSALYLVEIKSGPGSYRGDLQDWYRRDPSSKRERYMENPYRLANQKAKVLASRLSLKMKDRRETPWIEPLIFLSAADLQLHFDPHGAPGVVTRDTLLRAIQYHQFPGAEERRQGRRISAPVAREVATAIRSMGLRERQGKVHAGPYTLGEVLEDGSGYQDRLATHRSHDSIVCRARTYLVPQQTSVERRQQLVRAADRESKLLWDVREHPNVLRITSYETEAPLGPTVLFDAFDEGVPLSSYLRDHPELEFFERLTIIEQVGRALAYCHRKGIVHGALSPEAVLVRRSEDGAMETRLFNFQLGVGTEVEGTSHWSALASEPWAIYQAPELREDPSARSAQSDMFSLGALAYLVFTGQPPAHNSVELARRLAAQRHLDPRAVDDGMREPIAELICLATEVSPIHRDGDVDGWLELLLQESTEPDRLDNTPDLDPLKARKGDQLGGGLAVVDVLGQGATSRVLHVTRASDGRHYALKVPLTQEHDARLNSEADTLELLHHPQIVQLMARLTLAGKTCLLLSLAGSETLHRHLAQHGTVSLDLAARYGDDLLSALQHLEERGAVHRDIKPANLGVGAIRKSAAHLTLFDFSLSRADKSQIQLGTAAYRDPYLELRGSWDNAAEQWSAAMTLHEMLTGVRPSFDRPAIDPDATLTLAAERFDPSVRDVLAAFFTRAFARDSSNRFPSAEAMRRAWVAALQAPERVAASSRSSQILSSDADAPLTDEQLAAIAPETLVQALPLSPRAKNALDRAGLLHASDLLALPDNRLSAIRGIGSKVAKGILDFRNRWQAARALTPTAAEPFFPGYRGEDYLVPTVAVAADAAAALADAGLHTLNTVAAAPAHQLQALAQRGGFDAKALHQLLDRENRSANQRARPSTLEGWVDALLPARNKSSKFPRLLYGLDGPFAGKLGISVKQLVDQHGGTSAAVYIALGKARTAWSRHAAIDELRKEVRLLLDDAAGALPLTGAAQHLLARLPHDRGADEALLAAQAAALVRMVIEIDKDDDGALSYLRLAEDRPWVCKSDAHARAIKALAHTADELAAREVLAGQGETARIFAEAAANTPLAQASAQQLSELAALASSTAARSSRMEIYPRGMAAARALSLTAALLKDELTADSIVARVALRYPDAEPLPPRPQLDELLLPYELLFDDARGVYRRKGAELHTSLQTHSTAPRLPTALPSQRLSTEPDAVTARQFDQRLRNAVERRHLRVLGVSAERAQQAALELAKHLKVDPVPFDKLLIKEMRQQMKQGGVRRDSIVFKADRAGPGGKAWPNLLKLVHTAADSLSAQLLPPKEPLLLVQLGLLARYELQDFLHKLVTASKDPEAAAILLLIPAHDHGGVPTINDALPIPGVLPSQSLWVSPEWLANRHKAPAAS